MRFCMVTTFYPPFHFGGDAVHVQGLARALAARGHHVEVVHCIDAWQLKRQEAADVDQSDDGIRVHGLRSRFGRLSPLITQQTGRPGLKKGQLDRILSAGFDVIHFHNISLVGGPAVLPMGKAGLRLYTPHEFWVMCAAHVFWKNGQKLCDGRQCIRCSIRSGILPQSWRRTRLMERSFSAVDAILAPSAHSADVYQSAALESPVRVLPLFCTMPANGSGTGDGGFFLYAGRLERLKGIDELVDTFRTLDAQLWIAGDGSLRDELAAICQHLDNVRLLGNLDHARLSDVMGQAIAVIAPSRVPEIFGLSVVEAFSRGTPAIVADQGALPELVRNHDAGFVYAARQDLVAAVQAMQQDRNLRDAMGARARQAYQTEYHRDIHVDRYLETVTELLRARNP